MAKGKDIGALWQKTSTKGSYLSGYIEVDGVKKNIVCFINTYKSEQKHPDYKIYPSEPREGGREPRERTDEEQRAPLNENSGGEDLLDVPF